MNRSPRGSESLSLWVFRAAKPHWKGILVILAILAAEIPLQTLAPWPMQVLVDSVIGSDPLAPRLAHVRGWLPGAESRDGLMFWCLGATVLLAAGSMLLGLLHTWIAIGLGQRMVYGLAASVFSHLQRLSLRFHTRHSVGDSLRRVTADCGCVATIVRDCALPGAASLATVCVMFAVMIGIQPVLAALSAVVLPVLIIAVRRYNEPIAERAYAHAEAEAEAYETAEHTLSSMPLVQAFCLEARAERELEAAYGRVMATTVASTVAQFKLKILSGLAIALGTAGILFAGARLTLAGEISVGTLLVFISYLGSMYAPLESIITSFAQARESAGSARRVRELLEIEEGVCDAPDAGVFVAAEGRGVEVRLEGVTVGYEPERPVLKDVSLVVAPGETVGIVGATGSGKTTLVSLLPRLMDPWQGRVLVNGADVKGVTLRSLRESVAIVLQDTFLFPVSIAENIAYGRPAAPREQIEQAARAASIHEFIQGLPRSYDTVIGERGATLSGGERQRVAIARAILKNAPLLIMDEPTSSLDVYTESALVGAIDRLRKGRTTLVIAHRLSTLRAVDRIVVLRDGRIVETGSHDELLARGGAYSAFWEAESKGQLKREGTA